MSEQSDCDKCMYYEYDEEYDCYICTVYMDEDEMARFMNLKSRKCTYFRLGDEYQIVRKQI